MVKHRLKRIAHLVVHLVAWAVNAAAWDAIGLTGVGLISWGARMVYLPAGYIVGGLFLLGSAILHERAAPPAPDGER